MDFFQIYLLVLLATGVRKYHFQNAGSSTLRIVSQPKPSNNQNTIKFKGNNKINKIHMHKLQFHCLKLYQYNTKTCIKEVFDLAPLYS